jgi:hypothetical protein
MILLVKILNKININFSGLGLSSYVTKKDTGALAQRMMDPAAAAFPPPPTGKRSAVTIFYFFRLG